MKCIFDEFKAILEKNYNIYVFSGEIDLDDSEKEAVMNFSNDLFHDLYLLGKRYLGENYDDK